MNRAPMNRPPINRPPINWAPVYVAQRGFTLLEVLAAVVLCGMLMLTLSQGTRFIDIARRQHDRVIGGMRDLDDADRVIRWLIERADPGTSDNPAIFTGGPDRFALRSELPLAVGPPSGRRVLGLLAVDATHRLVLRWVAYRHVSDAAPDAASGSAQDAAPGAARDIALVSGVDRLECQYWMPAQRMVPGQWVSRWTGAAPPKLIRVRLVFPPSAGRSWPDIIAAPRRERAFE